MNKKKYTYFEVVDFMGELIDQNQDYKKLKEAKEMENGDTYDDLIYDEIKKLFIVKNESKADEYYIYKGERNE